MYHSLQKNQEMKYEQKASAFQRRLLRKILSASLVVGNTLCLGSPGLLGSEGQNCQSHQIRQHPVQVGADAQLGQQEHTVTVDVDGAVSSSNALKQTKQQRSGCNVAGLPVTEDHNRQSQEAEACHIAVGGAVGSGQGVNEAAHTGQRAGNGGTGVAHLIDIDAQRVRSLGILTTGTEPQAEAGLVQDDGQDDKQNDADIGCQIDLVDKGFAEVTP